MASEIANSGFTNQNRLVKSGLSDLSIRNIFIIPTIVFLILINVFPLLWSLFLSFHEWRANLSAEPIFVGIQNYRDILNDPDFWNTFVLTARYVVLAVVGELLVGFGVALLLNRDMKFKGLITTLLLLPMMMSPAIVGLFWQLLWNPSWGIINPLLGLEKFVWLSDSDMSLWAVVITDVWMWSPFVMLLSLAGLSAIPKHLYEAAEIDRASWWFSFKNITLPLVSPLLLIAIIFRTMENFKQFDMIFTMTGGGPGVATEVNAIKLYRLAFQQWDTGKSCAFAYIILIMVIGISNIYIKYLNKIKER
ncbi:MAG: sugar ABC transporter permease [Deltaproteobacteria bacterium]|jgi:multiple sugar transport system permease protein|nr:sugar ABC transporter permease [Deltaproteobacteria bacterium]MBT4644702.1 sugar ABC transporter permease [Deltaproteobacteria bacterium]MBT6503327.1 sugar ABC transporter permease [Deltaproteobacteria bacterium]MBT7153917.1 sugar ABC transporter permease [Deltaproteobacteria bacterium]MBT7711493.1 sugar ABC transporter permease [Deltaproteobacteria bacterium]